MSTRDNTNVTLVSEELRIPTKDFTDVTLVS